MGSLAHTLSTDDFSVYNFFWTRFFSVPLFHYTYVIFENSCSSMRLQRINFMLWLVHIVYVFGSNEIDEDLLLYISWTERCADRTHSLIDLFICLYICAMQTLCHYAFGCASSMMRVWMCGHLRIRRTAFRWALIFAATTTWTVFPMQSTTNRTYTLHKPQN